MAEIRKRLMDLRRFDRDVKGLAFVLVCLLGLIAAQLWIAAAVLGFFLAWALWKVMREWNRVHLVAVVEPEVKTYPEGCTCIRGALLDNPTCPHHQDEAWRAEP